MKLVNTVKIHDYQTMGIYQLSDELAQKTGKGFFLSKGVFHDYWLDAHDEEIVRNRKECCYEDLFVTEKEAYLTAKCVAMKRQLYLVKHRLAEIKIEDVEW